MPLTTDPAVIEPRRLQIEVLIKQLRITIRTTNAVNTIEDLVRCANK